MGSARRVPSTNTPSAVAEATTRPALVASTSTEKAAPPPSLSTVTDCRPARASAVRVTGSPSPVTVMRSVSTWQGTPSVVSTNTTTSVGSAQAAHESRARAEATTTSFTGRTLWSR
jgi:hypothetical protein